MCIKIGIPPLEPLVRFDWNKLEIGIRMLV